jgi:hypothetical protein
MMLAGSHLLPCTSSTPPVNTRNRRTRRVKSEGAASFLTLSEKIKHVAGLSHSASSISGAAEKEEETPLEWQMRY